MGKGKGWEEKGFLGKWSYSDGVLMKSALMIIKISNPIILERIQNYFDLTPEIMYFMKVKLVAG